MPEPFVKVSAYCRDGARGVEPELAPRWNGHFRAAVAGEKWLDFTLADKGVGLRQLCAVLGVPLERVMAFGDNYNDLPMLELAGRPYLMESAAEELRARGRGPSDPGHAEGGRSQIPPLSDRLPPQPN